MQIDRRGIQNEAGEVVKAGCVVFNDKGQLLLIKDDEQPKWSLPKGHVEPDENIQVAAERETEEETGYKVKVTRQLPDLFYMGAGTPSRLHLFLATIVSHQDKADEYWEWVDVSEVGNRLWPEVVDYLRQQKLI